MNRLLVHLLVAAVFMCQHASAQLLTWSPAFPTAEDTLLITFDAAKGNKGLNNYSGDVYIHTGVITSASTGRTDWKHVVSEWNTNNAAFKLTPIGNNKYQIRLDTLRKYYGITAGEQLLRLAMVFRSYNPGGSVLEGKVSDLSADQGNMYIPVYSNNDLKVALFQPESEPRYNRYVLPLLKTVGETVNVAASSNLQSTIRLLFNGTELAAASNVKALNGVANIVSPGNQRIIAEAVSGPNTVRDTIDFFVDGNVETAPLPAGVKDGINYLNGNTSVTLVLYAPGKNTVRVLGDFNNWTERQEYAMKKTPDGNRWWLTITGLTAGTEYAYQYLVNGTLRIADPYAEKILDPFNDGEVISTGVYPGLKPYPAGKTTGIVGVLQTGKTPYNWQVNNFVRPDKRNLLVYEVLVRDFLSGHNWKQLKDTVPYFKKLGINAIELMPFNEFEGNKSWGYNPSFYFAADKFYGTENDLKAFIDECHRNGIAVIMDMVLNHSFGQSPMVQLYFDAANNRPSAESPWFNPTAKHPFNVGYDMNHESAATKYFFSRVTEYWLKEYRIDGYRFDLSKGFTQKNSCTTGDCGSNTEVNNWSVYDASRVAIWKAYCDTLMKHANGSYVILEHLSENSEEKELSDYGMLFWGKATEPFNEATMGYNDGGKSDFSYGLFTSRGWNNPHLVTYMESHDEERLMYKNLQFGSTSNASHNVKTLPVALSRNGAAAAFFWLMPGPKMMWQFGEMGYDYSINYCSNGTVQNSCRVDDKPIRWDYLQNTDRKNLVNVYDSLLQLRNHPLFRDTWISKDIAFSLNGTNGLKYMIVRTFNDTASVVVVGNFGVTAQTIGVTFPKAGNWYRYMVPEIYTASGTQQQISLAPGEYRIFLSRNLYGLGITPVQDIDNQGRLLSFGIYPNPVNRASSIVYQLPEPGKLQISIHDISGRQLGGTYQVNMVAGKGQLPVTAITGSVPQAGTYIIRYCWKNKMYAEKFNVFSSW